MAWSYAATKEAYRFEWPPLWCAYSFFQCLFSAGFELALHETDARRVGSQGNEDYKHLVDQGRLFDQRQAIPDARRSKVA
jgi:hypothetical protein